MSHVPVIEIGSHTLEPGVPVKMGMGVVLPRSSPFTWTLLLL